MFIEKKKYKHKIKYYLAVAYRENGNTKKIRRYLGENLAEIELEKKRGQAEKFLQAGGKIYACGSCIKSREQKGSEMCPISTMKDMYEIVKESDKLVTF